MIRWSILITPTNNNKYKEIEEKLKSSFAFFLTVIWKSLDLPPPTPIQLDIAYFLQHGPKRCGVEAFRGVGKSYITAAFSLWILYNDNEKKIFVVSASKDRALSFSYFTKRLIHEVPFLQHLIPTPDQRASDERFDVCGATPDQSPSVKSVGINGQLTGSRADIIIADDVEIPSNSLTQGGRDKLVNTVTEFDAILKPLPDSRVIYLGTPQTEMSLYNTLAEEKGYTFRIWPALYPTDKEVLQYKGKLASYILKTRIDNNIGHTTEPNRFSDDDLNRRRISYGVAGFNLQFMLITSMSDASKQPLRCENFIVMSVGRDRAPTALEFAKDNDNALNDVPCVGLPGDRYHKPFWTSKDDGEMKEYTGRVLAVDPSGRGKDENGYAVGLFLHGNIFIPAAGGIKGGYDDPTLRQLALTAKKYKVNEVLVESNFGDGMYTALLKKHLHEIYPVTCSEIRVTGAKESRIIDILEPALEQHRLIIDPDVILKDIEETELEPKYSLFYQLTRLTREKGVLRHDDRVDALSLMVQYWTEYMTSNDRLEAAKYRNSVIDKEIQKFCKTHKLKNKKKKNWLHLSYKTGF